MTLCYHTSVDSVKKGELQMRVRCVCLIIIFLAVSVLIIGCGEEDIVEPEEETVEPQETAEPEDPCIPKVPPNTVSPFGITPAAGVTISSSQEFTLDFDMVVIEVTVNGLSATDTGTDDVWIVSPILEPGTRALAVEWTERDGCTGAQATGPYTVVADED